MKVAITGNIGSGKTEVIKFLRTLKFKCISSDKIISELYKDDSIRKIILHKLNIPEDNFKNVIIERLLDTNFDRKLKKAIYPFLYAKKKTIAPKHQVLMPTFYEVPLLFEEKLSKDFDLAIFIKADTTKRKKRVLARGVSDEYFDLMNKKQLNQDQKELLADHTITNNSSVLNLRLNIIKLLSNI
jgi:dephospho-CoA kinase